MTETPIAFRILVRPDQVTSSGKIQLIDEQQYREQQANDLGTVERVGEFAFAHDRFGNTCPIKAGDRIRFKQFAGHIFQYKDELGQKCGDFYQIINDDDVLCVLDE